MRTRKLLTGAGAVVGAIGTAVGRNLLLSFADGISEAVKTHIKNTLTSTVSVSWMRDGSAYMVLTRWIMEHSDAARARVTVAELDKNEGFDTFGRMHLAPGQYWFNVTVDGRRYVCCGSVSVAPPDGLVRPSRAADETATVTVYGDGKRRMHKHLCDLMSRARVNRQFIDCPNAYGHSMTLTAPLRGFDSIVLNPENETRLHKHLSWFKASRSLFSSRGMSYKTGILLEGPPGTGKTSVCRAIANDLGYRIRLGDLSHIRDVLGQMEPKTLLLIEDIDKFIGDVAENNVKLRSEVEDNELSELDSDFESDSGVVSGSTRDIRHAQESRRLAEEGLQHLMQFMDGMTSMDDTVIVLTTNYPDRLPPELLRNGRIDLRLHIGLFGRPEAERLCRLFGHTDGRTISQLLDTIGSSTWSLPSTLHGILLGMDKHGVET